MKVIFFIGYVYCVFQVYHCEDGLLTSQSMNYIIGDNSLLCVLPDYCVCYKDANFSQTQVGILFYYRDGISSV